MTHPAPWSPPSTGIVAAGATPGGPEGLADFASWDDATWNGFLNAKFAAWLEKYNVPFEYLNNLASSIVLAFQGDPGPLEDLIEDAVREIPIVGDILADLWDAIRGEYEGDHPILLAIQGLFAPIRRVVQIFTGRPGGLGANASEVDDFWGDMQRTLKGEDTVGEWFEDVSIAAASGVETLAQNIQAAVQGGVSAGAGIIAQAGQAVADLFGLADAAQKIAIAAQQQIQDLQNETNQPGFEGFSWSTIFSGADGAALPSGDFVGTGLSIRGSDGHVGITDGAPDGHHYKITTHEFLSDTQSASIVLGNRFSSGDDLWTSVLVRCNDAGTEGVFARAKRSTIQVGRFTRSGSTFTWSSWVSASRTQNQGDILRIRTSGDNYYAQINGSTVIPWTDTSGTVSKGAAFRHAGFTEQKDSLFGVGLVSFRIASFAMADWLPPGGAVTTPAWRLRRGLNTEVALTVAHGAEALMPNGFYTIADLANQVTVDLTLGEVTIVESGWYKIKATSKNRDNSNDSAGDDAYDVRNAYRASPWQLYVDGGPLEGPFSAGVPTEVYLAAGQKVRVGVSATVPVFAVNAFGGTSTSTNYAVPARSQITHVGGASPVFTGRKFAS
ncbi:minor tail protein [Gordonia phage MagicMan]|uniref:Minor tail protein n=1 Tax=Gordonia phage Schnabeltier TaxID=1821561 RepID=A0A142KA15_9CAUD|nr:minor tail protein [Gordonia phage Schnabeltier]AMS02948.1 minor tail protein [Gordonia phage Schnabeltier]QDM55844.1 minor tail protein [Gordonia phage MagicMan]